MLAGFYIPFSEGIDKTANANLHRLARQLIAQRPAGVTDILPSYTNLYVEYDRQVVNRQELTHRIEHVGHDTAIQDDAKLVTIPVDYDGEDLPDISQRTGLTIEEVIQRHSGRRYHVYATGFTPGFPFMAEVDASIQLPRKGVPRAMVPAHSVAMTGPQTGVYALPTPGGWNILGTSLQALFDPGRAELFLVQAGDQVEFVPSQGKHPAEMQPQKLLPDVPKRPRLRVAKAGMLDLMVDRGRFMVGRFGLGRSGPLDPPLARLAHQLLGNDEELPLLELTMTGPQFEVLEPCALALTGWAMQAMVNGDNIDPFQSFVVNKGDRLSFKPQGQGVRSYLAIAGGFEANSFLGSCSVDLKGFIGQPLQAGDTLGQAQGSYKRLNRQFVPYRRYLDRVRFRLLPGPQADQEALAILCRHTYTVASADRMGIRFEGQAVPGQGITSEAVPIGAIQVTSSGMPILLLTDRGTLGGYSKPALVHPADLYKAAQLKEGDKVHFVVK